MNCDKCKHSQKFNSMCMCHKFKKIVADETVDKPCFEPRNSDEFLKDFFNLAGGIDTLIKVCYNRYMRC